MVNVRARGWHLIQVNNILCLLMSNPLCNELIQCRECPVLEGVCTVTESSDHRLNVAVHLKRTNEESN